MKKLFLMCCFLIGISAVSFAQGAGRQQMSPADRAASLKTSLSLNDDQTAKITAIYTSQAKSRDSLMATGGDRSTMMPAMMAMRTSTNAKIKAILTADQAKAFDALPQNQPRGQGGPPRQ